MNARYILTLAASLMLFAAPCAFAQQQDPEKEEKDLQEAIEKELESLTSRLALEDWQVFYVDSIMNHDYRALREELKALNAQKVGNIGTYQQVQDKWAEKMYAEYKKLFTPEQWDKYNKSGAGRNKKSRDKRADARK